MGQIILETSDNCKDVSACVVHGIILKDNAVQRCDGGLETRGQINSII